MKTCEGAGHCQSGAPRDVYETDSFKGVLGGVGDQEGLEGKKNRAHNIMRKLVAGIVATKQTRKQNRLMHTVGRGPSVNPRFNYPHSIVLPELLEESSDARVINQRDIIWAEHVTNSFIYGCRNIGWQHSRH